MTQIYDHTKIKNFEKRPQFNFADILKLDGCKMSSRKFLKLNETPESHPTARRLKFLTNL